MSKNKETHYNKNTVKGIGSMEEEQSMEDIGAQENTSEGKETIESLSNRRQYFRVEDKVFVTIEKIQSEQSAAEFFNLSPAFGLLSEFQTIDVESKQLLHSITDKNKSLGHYLKLLNKKLDSLSRVMALSNQMLLQEDIQVVNLSEGGLAMPTMLPLQENDRVAIKLVLLPSYCGLLLEGQVLSISNEQETPPTVHIEFMHISDPHRQLIARHIMRRQSLNNQSDED